MPASPQRRTRRVAPVQDVEVASDVLGEAPARSASQLRRVQAATADPKARLPKDKQAAEVADGVLVAPISGRYFRLSESIGLMPLMEWAAAQEEVDARNFAQLLGFYRVLKDLVHPDEWLEFKAFTREAKCGDADFAAFQNAAVEAITARPTQEPAAS